MHELLVQWVGYVVPWIEALGIVMVLWGILGALAGLVQRGWSALAQHAAQKDLGAIRLAMGEKMVLGLEFFLAGDIVQTIRCAPGRAKRWRVVRGSRASRGVKPLWAGAVCRTAGRPRPAKQINAPCPRTREGLGCPVAFIEGRRTRVVPTWNSLAILGGIVAVRTVIVYFLNLELNRGARHG